jgi:voltage-gated potassium channel
LPFLLSRVMRALARLPTGATPAMLLILVFVTSWPLMALAEPAGAAIVEPANYWWWFFVTASTVGYGDFYPVTAAGHAVGVYVVVGGIATLTTILAQLVATIERTKWRRMKGQDTVTTSDHIAVLGYTAGRSERLIDELLADGDRRIVLCAWDDIAEHPMPDRDLDFVRGALTDEAVLRRAGVARAHSVLVDARDDNEALAIVVTVNHVAPGVHLVAGLRDMARSAHLHYVHDAVRCVQWHSPRMLTEELQSPGISQVYTELMTHGGANTYSVRLPDHLPPVTYGDCQVTLGRRHDATLLAARTADQLLVSPPWQTPLSGGAVLYYVGERRLTTEDLATSLHARA